MHIRSRFDNFAVPDEFQIPIIALNQSNFPFEK